MDNLNSYFRTLSSASLIAALALSFTAGAAFAQLGQSNPPAPSQYHNVAAVVSTTVANAPEPCGGDFGMLEKTEAERHDVTQTNPSGVLNCE